MIYKIANKNSIGSKSLRIRFHIKDGFIRIYGVTRYLLLLSPEKHDAVYYTIRYLINLKRGIAYIFSQFYAEIKVVPYKSLLKKQDFGFG